MANLSQPAFSPGSGPGAGAEPSPPVRHLDMPWPDELLTQFSLRMASHGLSISRVAMRGDSRYATQQLNHARSMNDPTLALLVDEMCALCHAHPVGRQPVSH